LFSVFVVVRLKLKELGLEETLLNVEGGGRKSREDERIIDKVIIKSIPTEDWNGKTMLCLQVGVEALMGLYMRSEAVCDAATQ